MSTPLDTVTSTIIASAINIHRRLGPGLLESVYETLLHHSLMAGGLDVQRQVPISFIFEGFEFNEGFRIDLLVADTVIIELKSVQRTGPVHAKQLLTYLRLTGKPLGLLLNFGAATLKEGLHRIVNNLPSDASPVLRLNGARAPTTDTAPSTAAAQHCLGTAARTVAPQAAS